MRSRLALPILIVTLLAVILVVGPEPGKSAPQKGQKGGFDPKRMFEWNAKGRDHFLISDLWQGRKEIEEWAKENGVTDGKITWDQYQKYSDYRAAQRAGGN